MAKYKFWDKMEDIYFLSRDKIHGKTHLSAQEYIDTYAGWAANPNAKVVVADGDINGLIFMSFSNMKDSFVRHGGVIPEGATDEEILALIEESENKPTVTEVKGSVPSAEERIAAALEYQNMLALI